MYIERTPDTVQTDHIDWGFRLSGIYGENYRYTTSYGLFSYQLLKKNDINGYDFPMVYSEVFIPRVFHGLNIRFGQYISLPDIEAQLASNNHVYTHSLTYNYDNYTNTAIQRSFAVTKNLIVQLGISDGTETPLWHSTARIANQDPYNPLIRRPRSQGIRATSPPSPRASATASTTAETTSNPAPTNKPVEHRELLGVVHDLVVSGGSEAASPTHDPTRHPVDKPTVFVVDDDEQIGRNLRTLLEQEGHEVETFLTGEDYLHATSPDREGCILIDANLPGMSGLDLLHRLRADGRRLSAIMITGSSDVAMAVDAMKAGATDFKEKPFRSAELLASLGAALERPASSIELSAWQAAAAERLSKPTARQSEIMLLVLAGSPSKTIAADLHISRRTVENHRASIMKKTGAASMPALARLAMAATWTDAGNHNEDNRNGDA